MKCKICNNNSNIVFSLKVLNKYNVKYYQCNNCKFIQTEKPYWLKEAYSDAISRFDLGLVSRNIGVSSIIETLIELLFNARKKFIDWGGGYGLLVRIMGDKGYDFYRQDLHCENLFAKKLDMKDLKNPPKFELITSFEVFEHLVDPIKEIKEMFKHSDSIFLLNHCNL